MYNFTALQCSLALTAERSVLILNLVIVLKQKWVLCVPTELSFAAFISCHLDVLGEKPLLTPQNHK